MKIINHVDAERRAGAFEAGSEHKLHAHHRCRGVTQGHGKVPAKTGSSGTRWPIRKAQRHHDQGQVHEEPECCSQGRADSDISPKYRCSMRSEEHTSELQSLMRISYAVFCLQKTK